MILIDSYLEGCYFFEDNFMCFDLEKFFSHDDIMKPAYLHPAPNTYYWTEADQLADYCINNPKRFHGHTLIWHKQLPGWMLDYQGSTDDWENLFKDHIL